jgi:hypothetical protein
MKVDCAYRDAVYQAAADAEQILTSSGSGSSSTTFVAVGDYSSDSSSSHSKLCIVDNVSSAVSTSLIEVNVAS